MTSGHEQVDGGLLCASGALADAFWSAVYLLIRVAGTCTMSTCASMQRAHRGGAAALIAALVFVCRATAVGVTIPTQQEAAVRAILLARSCGVLCFLCIGAAWSRACVRELGGMRACNARAKPW